MMFTFFIYCCCLRSGRWERVVFWTDAFHEVCLIVVGDGSLPWLSVGIAFWLHNNSPDFFVNRIHKLSDRTLILLH